MVCEISGRPCCNGIQGECVMTTREHCTFIRGYYHEDKYMCAQVINKEFIMIKYMLMSKSIEGNSNEDKFMCSQRIITGYFHEDNTCSLSSYLS